MGEVWRGTYYKPTEVIRDRKVVVVPKVEDKIFTHSLNCRNFFEALLHMKWSLVFISEASRN
jgi:hypothetical protein